MNFDSRIKVLYVCNGTGLYGSEKALLDILDNLNKNKYYPIVLLPNDGPLKKELIKRNIDYKITKYYSWSSDKKKIINIKFIIKHFLNIIKLRKIKKIINLDEINIIHSINSCVYFGAMIAKKYKIKHVWQLREYNKEYAYKWYAKKKMREADYLICVSKSVYNHFNDKYNLKDTNSMKIIYDGVNTDIYKNVKMPVVMDNSYNLLMAGSIDENKGQYIAIRAVENLIKNKNIKLKLYIAGDGPNEKKLKKYVDKHNLSDNIFFLGFVNNLFEVRKKINIFLMCSHKEAWGFVTIESLLSKNLVIGSNSGGTAEIIQDKKNGLLFNTYSWLDLSNKIEYAINNWNDSKKIIDYAYKTSFEKYSIKKTILEIESIYDKIGEK